MPRPRAPVCVSLPCASSRVQVVRTCNYGMIATSRTNLHAYPRALYAHVLHDTLSFELPQAAYLIEKAAHMLLGADDVAQRCEHAHQQQHAEPALAAPTPA
jgi:hypothetical protein